MKYYKEIEIEEHLLYAKEIAKAIGLYSKSSNMLHSTMMKNALEQVRIKNLEDKIFYSTKNGMAQVYPKKYIKDAIDIINSKSKYVHEIQCYHYKHKEKNYYFTVDKEV